MKFTTYLRKLAEATLARGMMEVYQSYVPSDASANGMHAWHAASNAYLAGELGLLGAPFIFLGGIYHETPFDWGSFRAEQSGVPDPATGRRVGGQGSINHFLDSMTDMVSNVFGLVAGYLNPGASSVAFAAKWGNYIPGPGEPDPAFGGGGGQYKGQPWDAWGQYPK